MNSHSGKNMDFSDLRIVEIFNELQKIAKEFGHNIIAPPMLRGKSGVSHSFSFLVASEKKFCGVDIYGNISEVKVLKTYIKKLDTGASVCLISTTGAAEETGRLCASYGLGIFTGSDLQGKTKAERLQTINSLW